MADWVAGVQREAQEWSHPAQEMMRVSSERGREAELWMRCLQGVWA